jgi:trimethylamine--corrinoid protein Co-methyltransferase
MRKGTVAATEMTTGWGLRTFTRDGLEKLHAATLDVLRTTGVSMDCDEALDILAAGGCWVNKKTRVVKFPDHVVTQAMSMCPSHILLAGRDPENDFMMGGKQVGFTTFGVGVKMEDLETGEIRESTKADVAQIARLTDALTLDMQQATAVVGVPEMAMISAGAADLANFYGIPSYVAGG